MHLIDQCSLPLLGTSPIPYLHANMYTRGRSRGLLKLLRFLSSRNCFVQERPHLHEDMLFHACYMHSSPFNSRPNYACAALLFRHSNDTYEARIRGVCVAVSFYCEGKSLTIFCNILYVTSVFLVPKEEWEAAGMGLITPAVHTSLFYLSPSSKTFCMRAKIAAE